MMMVMMMILSLSPQYGGKRCTGEKSEYKLCTNEECGHDYRNQRCSQLRKNLGASGFHGNGKDWIAVDPSKQLMQ